MTAIDILLRFTLEHAANESIERRVQIYRALSYVLPEQHPAHIQLTRAADELEEAEARAGQLLLNLRGKERAL